MVLPGVGIAVGFHTSDITLPNDKSRTRDILNRHAADESKTNCTAASMHGHEIAPSPHPPQLEQRRGARPALPAAASSLPHPHGGEAEKKRNLVMCALCRICHADMHAVPLAWGSRISSLSGFAGEACEAPPAAARSAASLAVLRSCPSESSQLEHFHNSSACMSHSFHLNPLAASNLAS